MYLQLPELQSLLYQQEGDTVFTVEYDIAKQVRSYLVISTVLPDRSL